MSTALGILIAILVACFIPFQAIVNGRLGQLLHNPLLAALVSFIVGLSTILTLLLVTTPGIPTWPKTGGIPWYLFLGGFLGVLYVTSSLMLVNRIGTANLSAATVAGQLFGALILDHYGVLGIPQQSISLTRVLGCALMLGGLALIQSRG